MAGWLTISKYIKMIIVEMRLSSVGVLGDG